MKGERKTAPVIRFNGFSDAWEQRKLDSIFKKIRNAFVGTATPYYVYSGHFYLESNNIKNGEINRNIEVFINDEFYNKQSNKLLHTDDIVMVQSGHVGHTAVIPEELDGTAAHALIMFTDYKDETNPYFLNYQFQTHKSKRKLDTITTGNTIKHILSSEMKEFIVECPSVEEQQKIGTFFKQLDNTIALHQRKLESLKLMKKGFLQQMFPKKGEKVPRLRFADFEESWEQRKLGEIFTERTERSDKGELISVTINSGIVKASELERKDNSSSNKANYKVVKKGDIAYNSMRMWQGASGCSFYAGILSPAYTVISPKEDIDPNFMSYMFKKHEMMHIFQRNSQGLTSDTWNLKFPSLSTIKVKIPPYEEQVRIANLLQNTENIINFQQNKISQLQVLKKAHLQNMFI
ncbi:restriction endonuclease subunit S [Listeria seeligeri]|uniref:restriction endonuclease subunit S n=1 Tax=Listeria seeligeri TaxID=1640 RepID=UPI0022EBB9BE|nr:restriction endonuclease subunit S [Listeria seeligeri]